jgi:hypothetical protein
LTPLFDFYPSRGDKFYNHALSQTAMHDQHRHNHKHKHKHKHKTKTKSTNTNTNATTQTHQKSIFARTTSNTLMLPPRGL